MGCLFISEAQPDINDIRKALDEKDQQIQELEKKIDEINQTMLMILAKREANK